MKKVWCVLSVSLLLAALILGGALSAAANEDNKCGAAATWSFADGVLTISGSGAMTDYENNAPWANDEITSVVIGKDITSIGATAFSGLGELETVTLEKGSKLNVIGKGAFYNCAKLTGISIPAGVTEIGDWAFFGCVELNHIDFCGTQETWNAVKKSSSWDAGTGAYTVNYLHASGEWDNYDENGHWRTCAQCTVYTASEQHAWEFSGVTPATHTEKGKITYTCVCGAVKAEELKKLSDCTYNTFEMIEGDETYHKCKCECGNEANGEHHWKLVSEVDSTHTKEGVKTELCVDCGMTKITSIPKTTEHNYAVKVSVGADGHKLVCACGQEQEELVPHDWGRGTTKKQASHTEFGLKLYTCACGETKTEVIPKTEEHTYGVWTPCNDDQHKKVCDCKDVVYAAHEWHEKARVEASHTEDGEITYQCDICKDTKTEVIPMTPEHNYDGGWEMFDDTQHKKLCDCNQWIYANHKWNDGEVIKKQTHVSAGEMKYTCTDCGAEKTEPIPAGHAYGGWEKYNATQHKAVCECGDVAYADHVWDEGTVTKEASHTEFGVTTYTCVDCGEEKTERIEKTIGHTYSTKWKKDATQHWHECACGAKKDVVAHVYGEWVNHDDDMHKKVCDCGSEILSPHNWESSTVEATHTKDGQKIYTCSDCGKKKIQSIDKDPNHTYENQWTKHDEAQHKKGCTCGHVIYDSHSWDKGEVISEATEQADGKIKYVCADCGYEKTEVIPKLNSGNSVQEVGCGATIVGGAAMTLLLAIGSVGLVYKKKED